MANMYTVSKKSYKLQIVDHVLDNLYGQIGITNVERELERLPLFKRLHGISQLGLTNWIFPCALHTRYIHSIGVMHNAYSMAVHINQNVPDFFDDNDLQIIRLTGLLHDIGHYPLSHNIEAAYRAGLDLNTQEDYVNESSSKALAYLTGCPKFLNPINSAKGDRDKDFRGNFGYHHEAIGQSVIIHSKAIYETIRKNFVLFTVDGKEYFNKAFLKYGDHCKQVDDSYVENVTKLLLQTIGSMVIGNYDYGFQNWEYGFMQKYTAMIQLIHSEIDADNLDYLLRDATFSGTSYGTMDVGVLLNSLTVREIKLPASAISSSNSVGASANGRKTIPAKFYLVGIKRKGIGCIDQYYQNKFLAYSQMIYNKYVSILEAMVLQWAYFNLPYDKTYGITELSREDPETGLTEIVGEKGVKNEFLQFTDSYILQHFSATLTRESGEVDLHKTKEGSGSEDGNKAPFTQPEATELIKIIVSRLGNFVAFDIDKDRRDSGEILCVGNEKEICDKFHDSQLYGEFCKLTEGLSIKKGLELFQSERARDLFAYRFEEYSMTKQYPKEELAKHVTTNCSIEKRIRLYFYRLANGVPILDEDEPYKVVVVPFTTSLREQVLKEIQYTPDLIVDSHASALRSHYNQKLVFLRKYKIENYIGNC